VALFIQINTDNQVESDSDRDNRIEEQVRQRLARFEDRITDIEIHVSDVNGSRGGNGDLRCTLEARINGIPPVAVADHGTSVDRAIIGAAKKAARALDHQLGKLSDRRAH
jgi:ribosome-associated translation inhibitor RaiA